MGWIKVGSTPKSEKFKCSKCDANVFYIDGDARTKNGKKESECLYTYCPYCRTRMVKKENGIWEVFSRK